MSKIICPASNGYFIPEYVKEPTLTGDRDTPKQVAE